MSIKTAKRTAELILPKLEAVRGCGNGTTIHDVTQHIGIVQGQLWLIEHNGRLDPEEVARDLERVCKDAESFLRGLVK